MLRTQIWTEFLDYDPDSACGRRTTSTLLGKAGMVVLEGWMSGLVEGAGGGALSYGRPCDLVLLPGALFQELSRAQLKLLRVFKSEFAVAGLPDEAL